MDESTQVAIIFLVCVAFFLGFLFYTNHQTAAVEYCRGYLHAIYGKEPCPNMECNTVFGFEIGGEEKFCEIYAKEDYLKYRAKLETITEV